MRQVTLVSCQCIQDKCVKKLKFAQKMIEEECIHVFTQYVTE